MLIIDSTNYLTMIFDKIRKRKIAALPLEPSRFSLWRRTKCKSSRKNKTIKQQYFISFEKNALVNYILRAFERDYSLQIKFLRFLILVIARLRFFAF